MEMFSKLKDYISTIPDLNQLSASGTWIVVIKLMGYGSGVLVAAVLTRITSVHDYGTFHYLLAIIALILVPSQLGINKLILRETAIFSVGNHWGKVKALWFWAFVTSTKLSILMMILMYIFIYLFIVVTGHDLSVAYYIVPIVIPCITFLSIVIGALLGLKHPVLGHFPENILRPVIFVGLLSLCFFYLGKELLRIEILIALYAISIFLTLIVATYCFKRVIPQEVRLLGKQQDLTNSWFRHAIPMFVVVGLNQMLAHSDILLIGIMKSQEDVALYKISVLCSTFVAFGLHVVVMVVAPFLAQYHSSGNMNNVQKIMKLCSRQAFLTALIISTIFLFLGEDLLELVFGPAYVAAFLPLLILTAGQLINTYFGPVGVLLNVTGNEKFTLMSLSAGLIVNILFNLILIPKFGINGAAIATCISLTVTNLFSWAVIKQKLNIDTQPFKLRM